jgi:hypothetical protein
VNRPAEGKHEEAKKGGTDMAPRHTNEPGTEPVHDTTAAQPHVHEPGTPPHTHETGYPSHPGHEPVAGAPVDEEAEYRTLREEETTRTRPGGMAARLILTLLGAAGMIYGAFLSWLRVPGVDADAPGTEVEWNVFFSPNAEPSSFWTSAGFVIIVLGVLAVIGLAFRTGWLTSLSGAVAVAAMILLAITFYRVAEVDLGIQNFGLGAWLIVGGGLLALIGGFFGARRRVLVVERERVVPT